MTTAVELVVVRCGNPFCSNRSGQIVGEVERGAAYRIKCPRCKSLTSGRA
ncbi:MAG: hypothetical protein NUW01_06000 [Gemmatimonadaceae bacterium]|nr:hypothetical protein [Gemmatimonadaceae bacterium]